MSLPYVSSEQNEHHQQRQQYVLFGWARDHPLMSGENIPSMQESFEWEETCKIVHLSSWFTNVNLPHGSILRPDKVLEPVAVEALLGYEKLKPMCWHVEGHITIGWASMFLIGIEKPRFKPDNSHISGWVITIWGCMTRLKLYFLLLTTLHYSSLALFWKRHKLLGPANGSNKAALR